MRMSDWSSDVCSSDLGSELPSRAGRYLRIAEPGPPVRAADRRHGRRADPRAQGRRAVLRADQGQHDQFRRSGQDPPPDQLRQPDAALRSEEHTSELQSLMRISYAVFCLKKKKT